MPTEDQSAERYLAGRLALVRPCGPHAERSHLHVQPPGPRQAARHDDFGQREAAVRWQPASDAPRAVAGMRCWRIVPPIVALLTLLVACGGSGTDTQSTQTATDATAVLTTEPVAGPTATSVAATATAPPVAALATATPMATAIVVPTTTPRPSAIPTLAPTQTALPARTQTALPAPTQTALPAPTQTALPAPTQTALPAPTQTALPTPTLVPTATATAIPLVLVLDGTLPIIVYDEDTQAAGGSNAHDIQAVLAGIDANVVWEETYATWENGPAVIARDPALIILHLSAFVAEQVGPDVAIERFMVELGSSGIHVLSYSRSQTFEDETAATMRLEGRWPWMRGRIEAFYVPHSLEDPWTRDGIDQRLRSRVVQLLGS